MAIKIKNIPIFVLVVFTLLVGFTLCSEQTPDLQANKEDPKERVLSSHSEYTHVERFGRILSYLVKVHQMLALVLFIIDCALRYAGIKLHLTHFMRYAIYVYGSSAVWLLDNYQN